MKIIINNLVLAFMLATFSVNLSVEAMNTWCVAKPSGTKEELTNNIDFVCKTLKQTNCTQLIENGGLCFEPDTLINHASVVMHRYYVENGRNAWNCDFKGTGLVTITDPSYSSCKYV